MFASYGMLLIAIATEVAATSALARTQGFRDPAWTVAVLSGYAVSIWLLALVVRDVPVSTAYAVWGGVGTAAVALIGGMWLGEQWDAIKVGALVMIVVGVIVLNLRGAH